MSQLKDYLHVRPAAMSPRKREDPDAGELVSALWGELMLA